jgi:hypothetical protein
MALQEPNGPAVPDSALTGEPKDIAEVLRPTVPPMPLKLSTSSIPR